MTTKLRILQRERPSHFEQRLDCRRRMACLDDAIRLGFEGFACPPACDGYRAPDAVDLKAEIEGMANLWYAIHGQLGGSGRHRAAA